MLRCTRVVSRCVVFFVFCQVALVLFPVASCCPCRLDQVKRTIIQHIKTITKVFFLFFLFFFQIKIPNWSWRQSYSGWDIYKLETDIQKLIILETRILLLKYRHIFSSRKYIFQCQDPLVLLASAVFCRKNSTFFKKQ